MNTQITSNRRIVNDRRGALPRPAFPFFDADNTLVHEDRRHSVERRSIQLTDSYSDEIIPAKIYEKLFIWHNDTIREFSTAMDMLTVGRSSDCGLVIYNRYISRIHAHLEYIRGQFVLSDQSTNGTYIKNEESEFYLVGEKATLSGNGLISLGTPLEYSEEGRIHFFCY